MAYFIAAKPSHVFEVMGEREKRLRESATQLIVCFHEILNLLHTEPTTEVTTTTTTTGQQYEHHHHQQRSSFNSMMMVDSPLVKFPSLLYGYFRIFREWKDIDRIKTTKRVKNALNALYDAEMAFPVDCPSCFSDRMDQIRTQIEMLRTRMQQIAGVGALEEFDRVRQQKQQQSKGSTCVERIDGFPCFLGGSKNEEVAHELLIDPDFRLEERGSNKFISNYLDNGVRPMFYGVVIIIERFFSSHCCFFAILLLIYNDSQAFWDSLFDDFQLDDEPCFVRVLRVVKDVKSTLLEECWIPSLESSIHAAINPESLMVQIEEGIFRWEECAALVKDAISFIQKIQAPSRDAELRDKWALVRSNLDRMMAVTMSRAGRSKTLCKALEFLVDRALILRIDSCNSK